MPEKKAAKMPFFLYRMEYETASMIFVYLEIFTQHIQRNIWQPPRLRSAGSEVLNGEETANAIGHPPQWRPAEE